MTFTDLSVYFQKLESTASRITITEILAELYKKLSAADAASVSYLLQGRVAPVFTPIEFGIADKLLIRAIAKATGKNDAEVFQLFKKTGDLGATAEKIKQEKEAGQGKEIAIRAVFEQLKEVAQSSGAGSQDKKLEVLADLITKADSLSSRYIVRIPLAKLRLGFSDMTILDALSWMETGGKSKRKEIEKAYNVRPDLGFIAETIKNKGITGLSRIAPQPGTPILMVRANRLTSAQDIILKLGKCAIEYKYDGLRLQVHYKKSQIPSASRRIKSQNGKQSIRQAQDRKTEIKMYSRNLEDITPMFPDIAEAVSKQIKADEIIFEGEVVAFNPKTHVHVPFQETMQRKRKYNISEKALEIPVKLYVFELLYADGKNYIHESYNERKRMLKTYIKPGETIMYAQEQMVTKEGEIETIFTESVKLHFEGIIAKKLSGTYEAGVRGWNWIKFKKAMDAKLNDTVDCVVMGYTLGEGKRTAFGVGQFLAGIYDPKTEKFLTITKVGTGLTDEQFREFITRTEKLKVSDQPKNYEIDKLLEPDIWLQPKLVVELGSDEITRSPVHTAGRVLGPSKSGTAHEVKTPGFALRFPRLVKFRDDKSATEATYLKEIESMYRQQTK